MDDTKLINANIANHINARVVDALMHYKLVTKGLKTVAKPCRCKIGRNHKA